MKAISSGEKESSLRMCMYSGTRSHENSGNDASEMGRLVGLVPDSTAGRPAVKVVRKPRMMEALVTIRMF